MIKLEDVKIGDYVLVESEGRTWQCEVARLNHDEKEIAVNNGVQDFYFKAEDLRPIPLDEQQLLKLNFQKQKMEDGSVKYLKGAFRIQISAEGNFSNFEMWYRDEKRHMLHPIGVHDLQNHYMAMT